MNRLDTIATHQRTSRVRDLLFASIVALVAAVSFTTFSAAAAPTTAHAVHK